MSEDNRPENKVSSGYTSDPFWNYHPEVPLKFAPYYDSPRDYKSIVKYWLATWHPLGSQFIFLVIAVLVWLFFTPTLERTLTFKADWIFEIWVRDMVLILSIAGGLHLYLHTFKKQGAYLKYDKRDLAKNSKRFHFKDQTMDNMFWTLATGVPVWVAWESLFLWAYANGYASIISFENNPIWFIVLSALVPIWALIYFDLQHRLMHKASLYKHVHYWHHQNGNTGPWSGLAMHPVEQGVLMSDSLIYFLLPSHPIHVIHNLLIHGLGAPTSHAGFESVSFGKRFNIRIGDFYHQLHHRFFDTNFGTQDTPWDKWGNVFHDGSLEGHKRFMQRRKTVNRDKKPAQ